MFMLKDIDGCLDLLIQTNRIPEAAFMARTYAPSRVSEIVTMWKADLSKVNKKAAEALADPTTHIEMFDGLEEALVAESASRSRAGVLRDACEYGVGVAVDQLTDAIDEVTIEEPEFVDAPEPEVQEPEAEPEVEEQPEPEREEQPEPEVFDDPGPEAAEEDTPNEPLVEEEPELAVGGVAEVEEDWGLDDDEPAKAD